MNFLPPDGGGLADMAAGPEEIPLGLIGGPLEHFDESDGSVGGFAGTAQPGALLIPHPVDSAAGGRHGRYPELALSSKMAASGLGMTVCWHLSCS